MVLKSHVCEKCGKQMQRAGTLIMSNTKFEVWKCMACNSEKKIAVGVLS